MSFAGFIMTYEREDVLAKTINKIFDQTRPPEKLLIVDNSHSDNTERLISQLSDSRLAYFRMGYNGGPAGAAKVGMQILAREGFEWIYWGDDDDPPRVINAFEILLSIPGRINEKKIGALGLMGNRFNFKKGAFSRIPNEELKGIVEVDSIAGNNTLIINGQAALKCALPDQRLFFGLEELDYCLSLKGGGYKLFIDGDMYFLLKKTANKHLANSEVSDYRHLSFDVRRESLWREYYSIRNLIFLLIYKRKNYRTAIFVIIKFLVKVVISFRRGVNFGYVYGKTTLQAIIDALRGKMGKTIEPGSIKVQHE